MKFVVETEQREEVIKNTRFRLSSTGNKESTNILHNKIMDGSHSVKFLSTDAVIGEISHVIEIDLVDKNETEIVEGDNNEIPLSYAQSADNSTEMFHNTVFISPADHRSLNPLEIPSEMPTYRLESFVNYYDPIVEDSLLNGGMPNIYEESFTNPNTSREVFLNKIKIRETSTFPDSQVAIFDHKMNLGIVNSQKEKYPCFCEIVISKKGLNTFTDILSKLDLFNFFINDSKDRLTQTVLLSDERSDSQGSNYNSNLLRYLIANISNDTLEIENVVTSRPDEILKGINFLDKLEAIGNLQNQSVANSNFKTVFEKRHVPNEVVYYKVEKFLGKGSTNPIKTYYVPSQKTLTSFIDTEVTYNNEYSYKVSAYVLIYGTEITYSFLNYNSDTKKAKYKVVSTPSPTMIEINLFNKSTIPATIPPLSPSLKLLNESNSGNYIKMALSLREGRERAHFIKLLPTDNFTFRKEIGSDLVTFRYLKEPIMIEMMRLEEKPKSIFDFESSTIMTITDTDELSNTDLLVHKENLFPNKKYYYIFRTMSASGMVSNPSPIYEIELIKTADKSRISSKIIQTNEDRNLTSGNKMRQLLQIRPAIHQSILNRKIINDDLLDAPVGNVNRNGDALRNYTVGDADEPIWGRKFKIRIKSNESGKLIDVNVKFDLIKDENEEDLY